MTTNDAVERAAKAICDVDRSMFPDYVRHIPARTIYLDRARAALAAVAEPDADAIERAAKAMCDSDQVSWKNTSDTQTLPAVEWSDMRDDTERIPYEGISMGRNHYRDMAKAALQAAGSDAEWLHDVLIAGDVTVVELWDNDVDHQWKAQATPRHGYLGPESGWHSSPSQAIADAVAVANAEKKGGQP